MEIFNLLLRTTLIFFVLLVLARLLGKKQMSQLTFFNYVTGITIGSIAANIISVANKPFLDEFIGLIWWCFLTGLIGIISLKSGNARLLIDGQPTILIKKGVIDKKALQKCRINMDDISMLLREQNVFSILDVDYGILEPNGKLSILKKQQQQQATKGELNIPLPVSNYLPSEIIVDGRIIKHNLQEYNLDEQWLSQQLRQQNINSVKDVLYAEIQSDGSLYVQKD